MWKIENFDFSSIFFEQGNLATLPGNNLKPCVNVLQNHLEGTVSQIFHLGHGLDFMERRKMCRTK